MSDWRLQGQERYLANAALRHERYHAPSAAWDHDHCEFCSRKFSEASGDLNAGYVTQDGQHWICETCFHDFRAAFHWQVLS